MIIKCIIFIVIFLFITYRLGKVLGHFVKNRNTKNENKIFNFLYGFLTLLGINQILLTPCVIFHTSFNVAFYLSTVIVLLLVILSFIMKESITNKSKEKHIVITSIMCIFVIFQIILTTVSYKSNADDAFYVSLSTSSIDSEAIYVEEPSMGYSSEKTLLSVIEQIPTLELQVAIWSKISMINPAIICHSLLPMIIIFISYLSYYYLAKTFCNDKYSKIFLIILSIIFLFTGFSTRFRPGYLLTRTWQGKTIFLNIGLTMVISLLIKMDKEVNKDNIVLLIIANLFSIASSSTAIFIVPFTYLAFGVLKLIKLKWKDILYLIISFIPVIIYVIIFLILNQNSGEAFYVPREEVSIVESLEFYKSNIYLIYYVIATIIIMFIGTKTAKRYFCYAQLINLVTIWNPLFSNLIARYFTSSATFWRVLWIIPIEFAIAYCITRILENINNIRVKSLVTIMSVLILIIPGKFIYSFEFTENLENIPQCIVNQTNYILEKGKEQDEIIVLAPPEPWHDVTMRQLSSKIKLIYSRGFYIGKLKIEEEMVERTNLNQLYYEDYRYRIEEFNDLIKKHNINWMIVNNGNINLINYVEKSDLQKDCEIDGYTLYKNSNL